MSNADRRNATTAEPREPDEANRTHAATAQRPGEEKKAGNQDKGRHPGNRRAQRGEVVVIVVPVHVVPPDHVDDEHADDHDGENDLARPCAPTDGPCADVSIAVTENIARATTSNTTMTTSAFWYPSHGRQCRNPQSQKIPGIP